ncbi:MAG: DEAD/DEAH box helicase [Chloroflexota bacterium]
MRLDVLDSAAIAGAPAFGPSEPDLLLTMRRAQVAYLRASLARAELPITEAQLQVLRRHAAYLDLRAERAEPAFATDAWYVAGTIYEWMSRLSPIEPEHADAPTLTRGAIGDLIRASLAYSSGLHEGSSAAAARRALASYRTLDVGHPIARAAGLMMLGLLGRDFVAVVDTAAAYGEAVQASLNPNPDPTAPWPSLGVLGRTAEAAACLAGAMLSGSEELFAEATARFAEARQAAASAADDVAALVDRIARVAEGMSGRSTYRVLTAAGLPDDLVRSYAAKRPELWSNQVDAIGTGLLEPDRAFVLSLPTGSGKTFLAQLRILATLDRYPEAWVAYVAPTRALVREAHADLAGTLRPHNVRVSKVVAGAEAGVLLEADEVPAVTGARTCVVLTPERLDLYLRTSPDLGANLRLVVVDEAHHIGDARRGATLETLIALLRTKWPQAKPVLLSAFMPNVEVVREWLGEDALAHASPVRPTRQLRGIVLRHDEQRLPDSYIFGAGDQGEERTVLAAGWRRRRWRRREYDVGAIVSMNDNPPNATPRPAAFALPSLMHGVSWREQGATRPGRQPPRAVSGGTKISDILVEVAVALAAHPGMVLIFIPNVDWVEAWLGRIAVQLPTRDDLEPYARAVEAILGPGHALADALRHGCAYHHSQMPDDVARIVEAAAVRGPLDVLCATSGLQAGVNMPASIVLSVGDPTRPVGVEPTPRNFANQAGRAGRPGLETESLALFLPGSITFDDPLAAARAYLAPTDADVAVESALADLLEAIADDPGLVPLEELPDSIQQTLLALWAADMRDSASIGAFLRSTFRGPQVPAELAEELAATVGAAAETRGPTFTAFAKTALPYRACAGMVDLIPEVTARLQQDAWRRDTLEQARTISRLLLRVPYFDDVAQARLGEGYSPEVVEALIGSWVGGLDYAELAGVLGFNPDRLSRTVRVVHGLALFLSWGAGSLLSLVGAAGDVQGAQPLLPYFIRFGVSSPVAAYLRLLGISDRLGATAIAARYPADQNQDYEAVDAWTRSAAGRTAIRDYYVNDALTRTNVERDLGLEEPPRLELNFFAAAGDHPNWIAAGSVISIERTETGPWTAQDAVSRASWKVTDVPGAGVGWVIGRQEERLRGVLLVAR